MPAYQGRGVHGRVVTGIAQRIVRGEEKEGAVLDIPGLQAEFDVSLTVIREALKVLAGKGLVESRQRRGTLVQPRQSWNLLDPDLLLWEVESSDAARMLTQLAEVRLIIEPAAAALAAERRTMEDLLQIRAALNAMERAGSPESAAEADLKFHRAVLAATGNDLLMRMEVLIESVLAKRDRIVHGVFSTDDPILVHTLVYEAIESGDGSLAAARTSALLGKSMDDAERAILNTTRPTAEPRRHP